MVNESAIIGYFVIIYLVAWWGYLDSKKRGKTYLQNTGAFILILTFPIFGLLIYLFQRKSDGLENV